MDEINKEIIAQNAEEKREPDSDLKAAFRENPQQDFDIEEIDSVVAAVFGEADGPSWFWLVKVKEDSLIAQAGPYALISAWCDYTGWGCQDGLTIVANGTRKECINLAPEMDSGRPVRDTLQKQVDLQLPFGLTPSV